MRNMRNATTDGDFKGVACPPFGLLLVGTQLSATIYTTVFCSTCLLAVASTLLNTLVLFALVTSSQLRNTKALLVMLTIADLITALVLMPMYAAHMLRLRNGEIDCVMGRVLMAFGYTVTTMTCLNITFITMQLYHAIINPFNHQRWSSASNHMVKLVLVSWIVTSVSVLTVVFAFPRFWNKFKLLVGGLLFLIWCILLVAHRRVYKETKEIVRKEHDYKTNGIVMKRKTFKMVSTVLLAFGLCYLPYVVLAIYIGIHGINPVLRSFYAPWIEIMVMSSSLLDPLIYCFRLKSIRRKVLGILKCGRKTFHNSRRHQVEQKFKTIKQHTGLSLNSVNLSILTASMTSMSGIRFDHERKYHDNDGNNNHQVICKTLSQPSTSPSSSKGRGGGGEKTLEKFHREQASVLKKANYLYVP